MGSRLLKRRLHSPIRDQQELNNRLDALGEIHDLAINFELHILDNETCICRHIVNTV